MAFPHFHFQSLQQSEHTALAGKREREGNNGIKQLHSFKLPAMPALSLYLFWTDPSSSAYNFGCDSTEGEGETSIVLCGEEDLDSKSKKIK